MAWGAIGAQLLGGAASDRRASGGFGGKRGGFLGGTGFNPDVLRAGHRADNRYFKQRMLWQTPYEDRFHWNKARKRGLTPQEYYGSGAPGYSSPSGPSGGAAVLGNMVSSANASSKALVSSAIQGAADRATELKKTEMQTEAQKYVADTQARTATGNVEKQTSTQMKIAEMENAIKDRKVTLDEKSYNRVTLPQAAATLQKTKQETKKLINEVATTTPAFLRSMKLLSMGPDNTIQTALLNGLKIDITNKEQMAKLSTEEFGRLMSILFAAGSGVTKNVHGVAGLVGGLIGDENYQLDQINWDILSQDKESLGTRPEGSRKEFFGKH